MQVNRVRLANFRNYALCDLELSKGRNILVGENAQGKTNFLEAIELLASAKSSRANQDTDLIRWQAPHMVTLIEFEDRAGKQELRLSLAQTQVSGAAKPKLEKRIGINGVTQKSMSDLIGHLLVVSFSSQDLLLLRGSPRYRRDWIDSLVVKLRPALQEIYSNYKKSLAQRNKLLRSICEKGKVTVADQDQLLVWDKQLARFGARIIKERLAVLARLLPIAEEQQSRISREKESLSIRYIFKVAETGGAGGAAGDSDADDGDGDGGGSNGAGGDGAEWSTSPMSAAQLEQMEEAAIAETLLKLFKERRHSEIRRKQTLLGPHRDDLVFCLNERDALSFASQGQQRSIVLSLKMSELTLVRQTLDEAPVLLLDDVLAELDEFRQGLLMSVVEQDMQTIITTTHVSGFDPRWLDGAAIFRVHGGEVERLPATTTGYVEHVV